MKRLVVLTTKGLLAFSLMLAATSANAADAWINDLTIKDVRFFHDGLYRLRVFVNEPINTGCAEDSEGMLTWQYTAHNTHAQGMQSLLQQAVATGSKVNLLYRDICNPGSGAFLRGVALKVE